MRNLSAGRQFKSKEFSKSNVVIDDMVGANGICPCLPSFPKTAAKLPKKLFFYVDSLSKVRAAAS
jgi:myo-inositol-1-phosphate synthase